MVLTVGSSIMETNEAEEFKEKYIQKPHILKKGGYGGRQELKLRS